MKEIDEYISYLRRDKSNNTIISYQNAIKKFLDYFKFDDFQQMLKIQQRDILSFQNCLLEQGLAKSSVNANMRALKAMFYFFYNAQYMDQNLAKFFSNLKEKKKLPIYLTKEEQRKMLEACENLQETVMILTFLTTGVRREELAKMKVSDVDAECSHILIDGKGSKERNVPINSQLKPYMQKLLKTRKETDYIFIPKKGGRDHFEGQSVRLRIKDIAERAGLPEERLKVISTHKLRHTAATNLVSTHANLEVIRRILGHSDIATTMIYAHAVDEAVDEAVEWVKI